MKNLELWLLCREAVLKVSFMYGRKGSFACIEIVCVCGLTDKQMDVSMKQLATLVS
jgi:hypothetical protein